jgi:dethiobiotin synthetase
MSVLIVSGTGTGVGKTIVTAALAALWRSGGADVAVVKPAQTGVPGEEPDLDVVRRLSGVTDTHELSRFPDPLSPEAAARVSGRKPLDMSAAAEAIGALGDRPVLVEGAGGLLVRYDSSGSTIADLAALLDAPVLIVTGAALGTLNYTTLTLEALAARGLTCAGVVIGSWPRDPGIAERENLEDLATIAGGPLAGILPEGAGLLPPAEFLDMARSALAPALNHPATRPPGHPQ